MRLLVSKNSGSFPGTLVEIRINGQALIKKGVNVKIKRIPEDITCHRAEIG